MNAEVYAMIADDEAADWAYDQARRASEAECRALGIGDEDLPVCTACNGSGVEMYYDRDDNEISREEWLRLPEAEQRAGVEPCPHCHGTGYIDPFQR